jgi:1,4-dihydroxy-2-naphthoate octaprenyltransferase
MEALQARFRDKISEILQNTPTMTVAMGHGRTCTIETCYVVGTSDEMHCIVKPNPVIVEAVRDDAHVAFTVNHGFPKQMLQGAGRAFYLGGLDLHPQIREQTMVKTPDATAFLTTIRNLGVLKIVPEQIAITDDSNLGLGPRPVYVPDAAQALPDQRRRWLGAIGIASWPLVLLPVVIAALLARQAMAESAWWLLIPAGLLAVLIYVGTVLLASYTGFRRRVERSEALGFSRVLHEGLLPAGQVWAMGLLCLTAGVLLGLFLARLQGGPLLLLGVLGVVAAVVYAGWPLYLSARVVEDLAVSIGLGPLPMLGTFATLTGNLRLWPLLVSLPLGCLAESILHASHLQTFAADANTKVCTLAVALGWERARLLFYGLVGFPYVLMVVLILTGVLPGWAWLTFLSLPLAGRTFLAVWRATTPESPALNGLDRQMAWTYLAFAALLGCSLILG